MGVVSLLYARSGHIWAGLALGKSAHMCHVRTHVQARGASPIAHRLARVWVAWEANNCDQGTGARVRLWARTIASYAHANLYMFCCVLAASLW